MSPKPSGRAASSSSTSRGFDKELAELESLAEAIRLASTPDAAQIEQLRKALNHRNNFIVAKAAKLVAEYEIFALLPEILAAYNHFFIDAVKSDPKCWAKNALVKALVRLEHREKDAYLRGLGHQQLEPVMGGKSDSAGALRGACTHALVNCPGITDADLLTILLDPLVDTDKTVRMEAARAIGHVGGPSAALLLRLRTLLANDEPEVLGACFSSLLGIEDVSAIPLIAKYLKDGDDLSGEAAFALADTRLPGALAVLIARLKEGADSWFTSVLMSAIALTRLPEAAEYLLAIIAQDGREAPQAIEAIARSAPQPELCERLRNAVKETGSRRLVAALREHIAIPP
jgi:HEAT repeat protein